MNGLRLIKLIEFCEWLIKVSPYTIDRGCVQSWASTYWPASTVFDQKFILDHWSSYVEIA